MIDREVVTGLPPVHFVCPGVETSIKTGLHVEKTTDKVNLARNVSVRHCEVVTLEEYRTYSSEE